MNNTLPNRRCGDVRHANGTSGGLNNHWSSALSKTPIISIVIPHLNQPDFLRNCLNNLAAQNFDMTRAEIIVVDNHSTDDTSSVVKSFSDFRIRYLINNRTKGACGARNKGIYCAKGKWVAFLDDDDIWLSDKLKYQYELARNSTRTTGLICTDYAIFKENLKKPEIFRNGSSPI